MESLPALHRHLPRALLLLSVLVPILPGAAPAVVFQETGFPSADTALPAAAGLHAMFSDARFAGVDDLAAALKDPVTPLLVLPYGSAFPEAAWKDIQPYLSRGGNLLVLGGRPFTRPAFRTADGWRLRNYTVRFSRELRIDEYQETPGSQGLDFEQNPDLPIRLPRFAWIRAYSPVIRLSAATMARQPGAAGSLDARLDTLAWGSRGGRRLAAPALRIDQLANRYAGGRWVFLSASLPESFYAGAEARRLVAALSENASRGSEEFTVRPDLPLYLAGEQMVLQASWKAARKPGVPLVARVTMAPAQQPSHAIVKDIPLTGQASATLGAPAGTGLYLLDAKLLEGERILAIYRSGFWMRDEAYLRSGPKLGVNQNYFELDGRPLAVVGTTYMASDVQRLFFEYPNVYVWDRDLREIQAAGFNMLRTGWWWGWDRVSDKSGVPTEHALRTLEAYLMTARKYGLPVQFCLFAFEPEPGGKNPYMDPEAVATQERLCAGLAARFRDVPFLSWDLINEPTISRSLWSARPNGDAVELTQWNAWLRQRHPDRASLADRWNALTLADEERPSSRPLQFYDFQMFVQEKFLEWATRLRNALRPAGAQQLMAVGQDEVGDPPRPCPAFFAPAVDFTANHSWWLNDFLLWDSLVTKTPGKAMLIQETGAQPELNFFNDTARRTPESTGALTERKAALSFAQGSGVIQWLWHTNSLMTVPAEATIGALRADETEKFEAAAMRGIAAFANNARDSLRNPVQPVVAIVTSQAASFSSIASLQIEAQRKAVRALAYTNRVMPYIVAENQVDKLGTPKLAILPSPQALGQPAWQALLRYVESGGNLLITGPVGRDPYWQPVDRTAAIQVDGKTEPLTYHAASIRAGDQLIRMSFDGDKQKRLETMRFPDAANLVERAYGKGRVFWAAFPVELAEGTEPAGELYAYALKRAGVEPLFQLETPLSPGVLIYPTVLQDAMMYIMVSEDASDAAIDLTDKTTRARLRLRLPSERAAMAVLRKGDGKIIAQYGF